MNRETKHGPRTDEQLGHETDAMLKGSPVPSHSREDVQQETLWEEEDSPAPAPAGDLRPDVASTDPGPMEAEARAELARSLAGAEYPARREDLVARARRTHAPDAQVEGLERLPDRQPYGTFGEVWDALQHQARS